MLASVAARTTAAPIGAPSDHDSGPRLGRGGTSRGAAVLLTDHLAGSLAW
jgi:hypothetical protein